MNAFLVLDLAINDFAGFSHYMAAIPAHIARYDGRYIVKGAVPTCIEGDWRPQRMVIIELRPRGIPDLIPVHKGDACTSALRAETLRRPRVSAETTSYV